MQPTNNAQLRAENKIGHIERTNVRETFVHHMQAGNDWANSSL